MNQNTKPTSGNAVVFLIASGLGIIIALVSSGTVRNPFVASQTSQPATIEQALNDLQSTLRSIQDKPINQSLKKDQISTSLPARDAFSITQKLIDETLDAQALDYRLHRLRNDLVPELERLERDVLAVSPSVSFSPAESKLSQIRIIGDLRREMSEKIASLERQRATLR